MGLTFSHPILQRESNVDWEKYVDSVWRSPLSQELDKNGGLKRPAVRRGNSFNAKLEFLGLAVHGQVDTMKQALGLSEPKPPDAVAQQMVLHTDLRAMHRDGEAGAPSETAHRSTSPHRPTSPHRIVGRDPRRRRGSATTCAEDLPVAEWRLRVHRARRRTYLLVYCALCLRGRLKNPRRMRRVVSFSVAIPALLKDDHSKFVAEQHAHGGLVTEAQARAQEKAEQRAQEEAAEAATAALHATFAPMRNLQMLMTASMSESSAYLSSGPSSSSRHLAGPASLRPTPFAAAAHAAPPSGRRVSGTGHVPAPAASLPAASSHLMAPLPLVQRPRSRSGVELPGAMRRASDTGGALTDLPPYVPFAALKGLTGSPRERNGPSSSSMPSSPRTSVHNLGSGMTATELALRNTLECGLFKDVAFVQPGSTGGRSSPLHLSTARAAEPPPSRPAGSPGGTPSPSRARRDSLGSIPSGSPGGTSAGGVPGMLARPPLPLPPGPHGHGRASSESHNGSNARHSMLSLQASTATTQWQPGPHGVAGEPSSISHTVPSSDGSSAHLSGGPVSLSMLLSDAATQQGPNANAAATFTRTSDSKHHQQQVPGAPPELLQGRRLSTDQGGEAKPDKPRAHRTTWAGDATERPAVAALVDRLIDASRLADARSGKGTKASTWVSFAGGAAKTPPKDSTVAGSALRTVIARRASNGGTAASPPDQGPGFGPAPPAAQPSSLVPARGRAYGRMARSLNRNSTAGAVGAEVSAMTHGAAEDEDLLWLAEPWSPGKDFRHPLLLRLNSGHIVHAMRDACARNEMMMAMYINRANSAWALRQKWAVPQVWDKSDQEYATQSAKLLGRCRTSMQHYLSRGQIAFQFLAASDMVATERGEPTDIWTADGWGLVEATRPGLMPLTEVERGWSIQGRALSALALGARAAGGASAVALLVVVLHINEDQEEAAVRDLWDHRFYGLTRSNVILVPQHKVHGYCYDKDRGQFVEDPAAPRGALGSGFGLMQLNWTGDACVVNEMGLLQPIKGTVMELLEHEKQVAWLASFRARDLAVLVPDALVDVDWMAQCMCSQSRSKAKAFTQVALSVSEALGRAMDSIIAARSPTARSGVVSRVPVPAVVEVRQAELASAYMQDVVLQVRQHLGNKTAVGMHRYLLHVPSLHSLLVSPVVFRPKLSLCLEADAAAVHIALDMADVTAAEGFTTSAVETRRKEPHLLGYQDVEALLPLLHQQDRNPAMREHMAAYVPLVPPTPPASHILKRRKDSSHIIVVFVCNNYISVSTLRLAAAIARAGVHTVHVVTVVADEEHVAQGHELLQRLCRQVDSDMLDLDMVVLVRGHRGLLDAMESHVEQCGAVMAVMGTEQLAQDSQHSAVGSVMLAALRRLQLPILVLTPVARPAVDLLARGPGLRAAALVEGHCMPLLHFLCSELLSSGRSDRLLLAQVVDSLDKLTRQQQINYRQLLASFEAAAVTQHRFQHTTAEQLEGELEEALAKAAHDHSLGVLALALPARAKIIPPMLVGLLAGSKIPVLVHKQRPQDIAAASEAAARAAAGAASAQQQQAQKALQVAGQVDADAGGAQVQGDGGLLLLANMQVPLLQGVRGGAGRNWR